MIRKYRFGNPILTESVVASVPESEGDIALLNSTVKDAAISLTYKGMTDNTIIYGLGEAVRGINKKGWVYVSNPSDDPFHLETTHSLYGAHNFIIVDDPDNGVLFGIFIDYPGSITFDLGYEISTVAEITISGTDADIYIIEGASPKMIIKEFRGIVGKSYIPPRWALGFGQSRWGYKSKDDITFVADSYDNEEMPIDMIYLDIDYMDSYKNFTVNNETFSDFESFVLEMKKRGIRLIPIIDAAIKIEEGYDVYEEGKAKNYFCKTVDGDDFVGAVWPGKSVFPDFLKPEVRKWFGEKYKFLLDKGIEGFWNDMNEPAIFYSEDKLAEAIDRTAELSKENIGLEGFFELTGLYHDLNGNKEYGEKFYHVIDGMPVKHTKVRNLYGYNMTRAAGEYFDSLGYDSKKLMFSRASTIGAHRYGGIWMGDNMSWWSHLRMSFHMLVGLNMAGFLFCGPDMGGFGGDTTEDLLVRWLQLGVFVPLLRNHSSMGTRLQEFFRFGRKDTVRNLLNIRYSLIPYLYEVLEKAAENNDMIYSPLAFEYPDDARCKDIEDELMLGNDILLAPVFSQNAKGRYVYLPEDMNLVRMTSYEKYEINKLSKGDHYITYSLDELLFFVKDGARVKFHKPSRRSDDISGEPVFEIG